MESLFLLTSTSIFFKTDTIFTGELVQHTIIHRKPAESLSVKKCLCLSIKNKMKIITDKNKKISENISNLMFFLGVVLNCQHDWKKIFNALYIMNSRNFQLNQRKQCSTRNDFVDRIWFHI